MQTIKQENSGKVITTQSTDSRIGEIEMDLDYLITGFESLTNTFPSSSPSSKSKNDEFFIVEEPDLRRGISTQFSGSSQSSSKPLNKSYSHNTSSSKVSNDEGEAQKKFGGAKAISSDQYFQDYKNDNSVSN